MVLRKLDSLMLQKRKLGHYLTRLTRIYLKWSKINIIPETLKCLDENIWRKFLDIGLSNDFLDMNPKAQTTGANKWTA